MTAATRRALTPVTKHRQATFTAGPGGPTRLETWEARSRETFPHPQTGRPVAVWAYSRDEDVSTLWRAVYMPTGQRRAGFPTLDAAREATAGGSLLAVFAAEDAEVMTQVCPGGCGHPAAALVNTEGGPRPVCAVHEPVIRGRGFITRPPANVDTSKITA